MTQILPVDTAPGDKLFLVANGRPVWPAKTIDEVNSLQRLARVFGATIETVKGRHALSETGTEEVVALGDGVEEEARLYAHLTERRFRHAVQLTDLAEGALPAVVVTSWEWLDSELLDILYWSSSGKSVPGIICEGLSGDLRRQVLVRAAAAVLCGEIQVPRIDLFPFLSVPRLSTFGLDVLGNLSEDSEVWSALTAGAGVLTVVTHSDGIDALLGSNLVLCPMGSSHNDADEHLSPLCRTTGICHRKQIAVSQALASTELVPPEALSARVLVWNACWGILPKAGVIDPAWGLARGFLSNVELGAVVTTWSVVLTSPRDLDSLSSDISCGVSVGEALARFLRSRTARELSHRMCLFGDPRVRVLPHRRRKALQRQLAPPPVKIERPSSPKETNFIRAYLTDLKVRLSPDLASQAQKTLEAVQEYEQTVRMGLPAEDGNDAPGPKMRRSVINFLFRRGRFTDDWLRLASRHKASHSLPCFVCGRLSNTVWWRVRIVGVIRRTRTCPVCGVIEDVPDGAALTLSLTGHGAVRLAGKLTGAPWAAGLYLGSMDPEHSLGLDWPSDSNGMPVEFLELPRPLPPGPLNLALFLVSNHSVGLLALRSRGGLTNA